MSGKGLQGHPIPNRTGVGDRSRLVLCDPWCGTPFSHGSQEPEQPVLLFAREKHAAEGWHPRAATVDVGLFQSATTQDGIFTNNALWDLKCIIPAESHH